MANKSKQKKPVKKNTGKKTVSTTQIKNNNILTRFFSHNITLLVLSFLLAFTIWFIIRVSSQTTSNKTISNIEITIELTSDTAKEDELEPFMSEDVRARVVVSGNPITVNSLSADDISVTPSDTSAILTPGYYTLPLEAKKVGSKNNYEIVSSVTPSSISFYVDKRKNAEFTIENRLVVQLEDSKHYATTSLSRSTVNVTGPSAQVSRIASVVVFDSIPAGSDETKTVQEKLRYLDSSGNELNLPLVSADLEDVDVTVTVLPKITVNLTVNPVNKPTHSPDYTIEPSTIQLAGPQSTLDTIKNNTISLGDLDYSKLKNTEQEIDYDISVPEGCIVISRENTATLSIDLSSYSMTTINCTITPKIDTSKYTVEFNETYIPVTVYGTETALSTLSASKITVLADFSSLLDDSSGSGAISLTVPLTVTLDTDYASCWIYGSYTANANVTVK